MQLSDTDTKKTSANEPIIAWLSPETERELLDDDDQVTSGYLQLNPRNDDTEFISVHSLSNHHYPYIEPTAPNDNPVLPEEISEYADVFSKVGAEQLPEHRPYDCTINIQPGSKPPVGKVYSLTREEDEVLRVWLKENLDKGFIRRSHSPYGAPCFFVKKKDGSLRLCMDYRALNATTVKDRGPIPLISEMIRALSRGKRFTTLDLRGAYNLLRIASGHEHLTAFLSKYGQYEFLVMPFGLANAPAQFQSMMNELFRPLIGNFVLVYLDDIVIYSEDPAQHWGHVREVLAQTSCSAN
jgi:hypothetical protein